MISRLTEAFLARPLLYLASLLALGIGLAARFSFALPLFAGVFALLLLAFVLSKKRLRYLLLLPLALLAGFLTWNIHQVRQLPFPWDPDTALAVRGMALENARPNEEGSYSFRLRLLEVNGEPAPKQQVLVMGGDNQEIFYGDLLEFSGKVRKPSFYANANSFDYGEYLDRQGIKATIAGDFGSQISKIGRKGNYLLRLVNGLRYKFEQVLDQLPQGQGSFIRAIFLGDKAGLTALQKQTASRSGIFHAFAVSGLHVGYLVLFISLLLGRGRRLRWQRFAITVAALFFYALLTNLTPSVLRASIMATIALLASCLDHQNDSYNTLGLAGMVLLLFQPQWLFDPGFQISFTAVLGLIYLSPFFQQLWGKGKIGGAFAACFAASLTTLPLIISNFHVFSYISLLISPLFVAGVGIVVMLALIGAIFAVLSPFLASLPLFCAGGVINLLYAGVEMAVKLPFAYSYLPPPQTWLIIAYYLFLLLAPPGSKIITKNFQIKPRLAQALLPLALMAAALVFHLPPGQQQLQPQFLDRSQPLLEVTFLDVGQGDGIHIITPKGKNILLDGGGNTHSKQWVGENILIPYLQSRGVQKVDLMINSHPHDDHIQGLLSVLRMMPVMMVMFSEDIFAEDPLQQEMERLALAQKAVLYPLAAGDKLLLEPDLWLEVFSPERGAPIPDDWNDSSLVLKLSYQKMSFLFTGDLGLRPMQALNNANLKANVLKIPHHGSSHNYDEDFNRRVDPQAVVICVGADNSFGHPGLPVLQYWQKQNVPIYRTDQMGSISFFSDGIAFEAVVQRTEDKTEELPQAAGF